MKTDIFLILSRILRKKLRETDLQDQVDQVLLKVQDHQENRAEHREQEIVYLDLLKVLDLPGIMREKDRQLVLPVRSILQAEPELTQQTIKAILSSRWNQTAK